MVSFGLISLLSMTGNMTAAIENKEEEKTVTKKTKKINNVQTVLGVSLFVFFTVIGIVVPLVYRDCDSEQGSETSFIGKEVTESLS
jgi:hypothetical protein